MDRQFVYDVVRDHLLTQNKQSRPRVGGSCRYRGDRGTMCAIGCLIPDANYFIGLEGTNAKNPAVLKAVEPVIGPVTRTQDGDFLRSLQGIHDSDLVENWSAALYDFALKHNLRP